MLFHSFNQRTGTFTPWRDGARRVNNHQGIKILALQQNVQGADIAIAAGIVTQIEWITRLYARRQRLTQALERLFTERGQLAVTQPEFIQRQRGGGGTVADDHQPFTPERTHMAERFDSRKEFMGILNAQ